MRAPLHDEADDARGGLLDRELRDVEHRATEPAVDCRGLLQLVVDLRNLGVGPFGGAGLAVIVFRITNPAEFIEEVKKA